VDGNEWDEEIESVVEEIKEVYVLAKGSMGSSKNVRGIYSLISLILMPPSLEENNVHDA
jgi:hypothetical protein